MTSAGCPAKQPVTTSEFDEYSAVWMVVEATSEIWPQFTGSQFLYTTRNCLRKTWNSLLFSTYILSEQKIYHKIISMWQLELTRNKKRYYCHFLISIHCIYMCQNKDKLEWVGLILYKASQSPISDRNVMAANWIFMSDNWPNDVFNQCPT